jgi:uncharacterized phiE125 gp8 family phage protein
MADAWNYENRLTLVGTITEPVSVTELKLYAGIDSTFATDDDLLTAAITAGREFVENETGRQLPAATYDLTLDAFPKMLFLPRSPLATVTSIKYQDTDDAEQTLATSVYVADLVDPERVSRIMLKPSQQWPAVYNSINTVVVRFTCGYATVPAQLLAAVKQYAKELYDFGEPDVEKLKIWLAPYRVHRW